MIQEEDENILFQKRQHQIQQTQILSKLQGYFNSYSKQTSSQKYSHNSVKNIPFYHTLFANNSSNRYSNILQYLYQFLQTNKNSKNDMQKNVKGLKSIMTLIDDLIQNCSQCAQQVLFRKKQKRQLMNRYLSIPTIWFNLASQDLNISTKYNYSQINKRFVISLLQLFCQIDAQNQLFLISKILVLSQQSILFDQSVTSPLIRRYIKKHFLELPKKHKIAQFLFTKEDNFKFLLELLKQNYCEKEVHYLLSSQILKQKDYLKFYQILQLDQKYRMQTFNQLAFWWALSKDNLLIKRSCDFRYNLLAFLVQKSSQKEIIQQNYAIYLSQGIHKRIVDQKYYKAAVLIWNKLSLKLGIQLDSKQLRQSKYFQYDQEKANSNVNNEINKVKISQISQQKSNKNNVSKKIYQQQFCQDDLEQTSKQSISHNQKDDIFKDNDEQTEQIKIKPPKTVYDCILGLQNQLRRKTTIKQLPRILKKYPDDIVLTWNQLIKQLLFPLQQDCTQSLIILFSIRPIQFIELVAQVYFKKDASMSQKILFMKIIQGGIEQLSSNPYKQQQSQNQQQFYFKKVSSRYLVDKHEPQKKQNQKSRRWGHTRLQFQKKNNLVQSLKIVKQDAYVNRFYEVANTLFFKIISKISCDMDKITKKQPILAQHILILLGTIPSYLKNHYQKYLILDDIVGITLAVITSLQSQKQKKVENSNGMLMGSIQVLNKLSLVIDKFMPQSLLQKLKDCVIRLKRNGIYGIKPLIQLIEANIYKNMFLSRDQI